MRHRYVISSALFLSGSLLSAQTPTPPPDIDQYVAQVMTAFEIPGIAVAIVKDGKVVLAKGYGVRELGKPDRVDERTRFAIASNSKAFTATALALLVEDGKLEWDTPVVSYMPGFALYDPFVTRELTVRDLLVHRSGLGLGAGDLLWWPPSTYDRKEIVRRLRFIKPATSFRTAYAYDNVLYVVAGELIEAVSGQSWEDFVRSRILARLGMTHSDVRHSDTGAGDNVAQPHSRVEGRVRRVPAFTSDNTNAAGGINTGAEDITKWLIVQLDSGRVADGSRLFSPRTTRQLWSIVTPIPVNDPPPQLAALRANFNGYGLGFFVSDYRGKKLVWHTGGDEGYVSKVALIPDLRLGVAVLTNQEVGSAYNSITNRILDYYLGVTPPIDYVPIYSKLRQAALASVATAVKTAAAKRDSTAGPSLPLAKYAGVYTDPWYGDVSVSLENGRLVMRFSHTPGLTGDLSHWQYDTFLAKWRGREQSGEALRGDAFVTFALNPDGTIDQIKMQAASPATDFSFDFQDLLLKPRR